MPAGQTLTFTKLSYSTMNAGWTVSFSFSAPASSTGTKYYFALQSGQNPPAQATVFGLSSSTSYQVFIVAPESPKPTSVLVSLANADGSQGGVLITAAIPASAFN